MEVILVGLTANSTDKKAIEKDSFEKAIGCDYTIAIAGNPNVGKSTIFNALTGMHQHTGNWPGKTVSNATGMCTFRNLQFLLVDIPGTYSLMSHSEEEEIARDYICFGNPDATVVIVDATCLERNLNLVYQTMEITPNIILCVNLLDEAKKKGISIDFSLLEKLLGIPVVGTIARKKKTLKQLMEKIEGVCNKKIIPTPHKIQYCPLIEDCITLLTPTIQEVLPKEFSYLTRWICLKLIEHDEDILNSIEKNLKVNLLENVDIALKLIQIKAKLSEQNLRDSDSFRDEIVSSIVFQAETLKQDVCHYEKETYNARDRKIDKILTSKKFGIPIMILFLGIVFWITIVGANYPSSLLSDLFAWIQEKLLWLLEALHSPEWLTSVLIDGIYTTLTWVIAVMLPPMAIFFPFFTLLEDLGYLPRIAFNLDKFFQKACSSRKASINYVYGIWL